MEPGPALTRGAVTNSFPPLLGCFNAFLISLHNEYLSTRKCNVGPLGVIANRRFVFPDVDLEKSRRWDTPKGPAMVR